MKSISNYELYIYFSYLPKFSEASLEWLNCDFESDFGRGFDRESWWVNEGVKAIKRTMANEVGSTDPKADHILLLSGGLDSRTILGGLLENLPKSKIITATYGIPGTWDFEFAKIIARKFGLQHEVINLLEEKWDIDQLVKAAARLENPVSVYESYVRQKINNHFGTEYVYWSGFMGDNLGGGELPEVPSQDKREAIINHLRYNPPSKYKDQKFFNEIIDRILAEFPWEDMNQTKYGLEQQLDFGACERFQIQPLVIVRGYNFKTPFLNKDWVNFMANVPYKWLLGKHLYKKIILESYKELSKLPSRATAGMPLAASKQKIFIGRVITRVNRYIHQRDPYFPDPRTNYINWTESLRHKGPFQETVYTTLQDLKERAIFDKKDLDAWWQDHLNRKVDYTTLLMNLSSLELLIKAGVM